MEPGLYHDVSHEEYHSSGYISSSYLSRLKQCPAKALVVPEETNALRFGRIVHAFILENEPVVVAPTVDRRTKAGKAEYAEFMEAHQDDTIVGQEEYDILTGMKEAILTHPFANQLLEQGESEVTVIWNDEETGLRCKCRPDRIPTNADGVFVDLKTTDNASEYAFRSSVIKFGYYRQAAMYMEGLYYASGKKYDGFAFIAVEKSRPFRVEVFVPDDNFLQAGYDEFHELLRLEKKCREEGVYPHYTNEKFMDLYAPNYMIGGGF